MKKPAVARSRTQDTSGLSRQCSATEPQQLDNHQPSQSSYMYCTGGTECLSSTPDSHSVCTVRTLLGIDRKILSIRKERMLSSLLSLNAQSILPPTGKYRCYEAKIKEVLSTVRYYATKHPELVLYIVPCMPTVHYVVQHVHSLDSTFIKLFQPKNAIHKHLDASKI